METELKEMAAEQLEQVKEVTHEIQKRVKAIPPEAFFGFGIAVCTGATILSLLGKHRAGTVFATWVPTALALGLYAKMNTMHQYDSTLPELPGE